MPIKLPILILSLTLISAIVMGPQAASGAIIGVPSDFSTIKEALDHSQSGDQVQVEPGLYHEFDITMTSGVTLMGMGDSPDLVVIDAGGLGRILLCEGVDETTIIQNITFTNGVATGSAVYDQSGGAILMNNSALRLVNCHFINNKAEGHGGALRCSHSSPQILNCHFEGNSAPDGGGGAIDCSYDSSPLIQSCFFGTNQANWGGALACRGSSSPLVSNSHFDRNAASGVLGYGGAAMADFESKPLFEQSTFYGNRARYGGALACFEGSLTNLNACTLVANISEWMGAGIICSNSYPVIENSIIAFHDGASVACGGSALPLISCTNIYGNQEDWTGAIAPQVQINNNLSADPLFCDLNPEVNFQFSLQDNSPSADENSPCAVMGAWPVGCNTTPAYINDFTAIWDTEVPRISWSSATLRTPNEFILLRNRASIPEEERPVPFMMQSDGHFVAYDNEVQGERGQDLVYRLYLIQPDASRVLLNQTELAGSTILKPLYLAGARPNPFNPSTTISFEISQERLVTVTVHNIRGQQVKELTSRHFNAGVHEVVWNGVDSRGQHVESGTYFVTVQSDGMVRSKKIMLLK